MEAHHVLKLIDITLFLNEITFLLELNIVNKSITNYTKDITVHIIGPTESSEVYCVPYSSF